MEFGEERRSGNALFMRNQGRWEGGTVP